MYKGTTFDYQLVIQKKIHRPQVNSTINLGCWEETKIIIKNTLPNNITTQNWWRACFPDKWKLKSFINTAWSHLHEVFKSSQNTRDESRMAVTRLWGKWGIRSYCLMEIESWFCNIKRITEMDADGLHNIMNVFNITAEYT